MSKPKILIVCGPTATGKSEIGMRLALSLGGEIVSADSMTVYRGMDIGTNKPPLADREKAPHHLIDVREPGEDFSAGAFAEAAGAAIREITAKGKVPVVVGGTGLYIRALTGGLFNGVEVDAELRERLARETGEIGVERMFERLASVDPEYAACISRKDRQKICRAIEVFMQTGVPMSRHISEHRFSHNPYDAFKIAVRMPRDELKRRIAARAAWMMDGGLVEETRRLISTGVRLDWSPLKAPGYGEAVKLIFGGHSRQQALDEMTRRTAQYAKRQITWFKADPEVRWYAHPVDMDAIVRDAREFISLASSATQFAGQHG